MMEQERGETGSCRVILIRGAQLQMVLGCLWVFMCAYSSESGRWGGCHRSESQKLTPEKTM